ncbi:hypothetical protein [Kutzneria buriramensis]|uniref:Uncharacterized protein n=1 Tax=Kutzneria buriramensis TaxID=1045776 RepID=A0A3E0H5V9_9PSEU|nr:hypothetical protein [Kutzneria buriramensis]REH38000.1 hypothetical protein BCF44_11425 [Kutzneria buriramensis]
MRTWSAIAVGLLVFLTAGGAATVSRTTVVAAAGQTKVADPAETNPNVTAGPAGTIRIGSGRSATCQWTQYSPDGITMQVDTSAAGFAGTPVYVTSIGGSSSHWSLAGTGAVYAPDNGNLRTGFRIYLRWAVPDGAALTPVMACNYGWFVQWIGSE